MDVDYDLYKMFHEVVKVGSFSKASENLFISQSAVTQAIRKLEQQLGGTLFIRSRQGVTLTEEGKNLYDYISESLMKLSSAENLFADYLNLKKGSIRIAGGSTLANLLLLDGLKKFVSDYPDIKISLINMITHEALQELATGGLDMVLVNLPCTIEYDNIKVIELKDVEDIFFTNKSYYKKISDEKLNLKKLADYKIALPAKHSNSRILLDEEFKKQDIEVSPHIEFSSGKFLAEFVKKVDVIGYANKSLIAKELENNELVELEVDLKIETRKAGVAILNKKIANKAAVKLVEYLK